LRARHLGWWDAIVREVIEKKPLTPAQRDLDGNWRAKAKCWRMEAVERARRPLDDQRVSSFSPFEERKAVKQISANIIASRRANTGSAPNRN
jgi:hypothetical protein